MRAARLILVLMLAATPATVGCSSTAIRDNAKEVTVQDQYELAVNLIRLAHATGNVDDDRWTDYYLPAIAAGDELIAQFEAAQAGGEFDRIAVINAALAAIIEQLEAQD